MTIVFLDTETTSLRHDRRAWEIGLLFRRNGATTAHHWLIDRDDLDLGNADLMSLKIGKFFERHPQFRLDQVGEDGDLLVTLEADALREIEAFTRGATIVGAVPNFDAEVLGNRMRAHGICPSWHYHLVDVETLAAGAKRMPPPWDFDALLKEFGLTYDEADRHTALGDARMVRDLYDAVLAWEPR